jgi:mRNA interferase RelE/StbE
MYKVELTASPTKAYAAADRPLARKIARCIEQLERDPRASNNSEPMVGPDAGKWR